MILEKVTKKSSKYQGFRNLQSFVDNVDNVDYLFQNDIKMVWLRTFSARPFIH